MKNTKASQARKTFRSLMAQGWTNEQLLIDAAAESIGGDESDKLIAQMVWRKDFCTTEAN